MRNLRRLALSSVLVALGTVMLGSWTRINGAGETCPDWPLCNGKLIPSMADGTIWEWLHRLLAFAVAPLVLAVIVTAWRNRARSPFIAPTVVAIGGLFAVQVLLGAATVALSNSPWSVVLHWGTAMAFVAALSALAIFADAADDGERATRADASGVGDPLVATFLGLAALVTFATMCLGAYVSSSGAGLACLSLPGCAGNVVVYGDGQFVQMVHRLAAAITAVCAAGALAVAFARPASRRVRVVATVAVGLIGIQVVLGLLNVALRLPTELREAHAINAALTFLAFVVATLFAVLDGPARRAAIASRP